MRRTGGKVTAGYCKYCDRLIRINPAGLKHAERREQNWRLVEHDDDKGLPCQGSGRIVE